MSRATTRPCGPEPVMRPSSMPASLARRRASGEEKMRAWPLACAPVLPLAAARRCAASARAAAWRRCGLAGAGWLRLAGLVGLLRPWPRRLAGAGAGRFHVLAVAGEHRDHIIDRHVLGALRHHDFGKRALVDGLDFHRRLVGLDFGDHVAGLDLVALFLEPLRKVALLHRRRQRGHQDVDRHCQ